MKMTRPPNDECGAGIHHQDTKAPRPTKKTGRMRPKSGVAS